jgi:DNA replication protein DnaC
MILNYTKKCGLLVLDDLGAHSQGQSGEGPSWAEAKFDEIINYRWLNKGRTIFTLNVAAESLPQRVRDRIVEGQTFVLHGPSYRQLKGSKLREKPKTEEAK